MFAQFQAPAHRTAGPQQTATPRSASAAPERARSADAELEADEVAMRVTTGAVGGPVAPLDGGGRPSPTVAPDRRLAVDCDLGGGEPLAPHLRRRWEPRFQHDFSRVRVHSDERAAAAAAAFRADAFTRGSHIAVAAGWAPHTPTGERLLAHELAHVVQQELAGTERVQLHLAADPRLPATQAEAIANAIVAQTAIDAANASFAASADRRRHDAHDLAAQEGFGLTTLTPRHDSPVGADVINFFVGHANYATTVALRQSVTHDVGGAGRKSIRVRARDHGDVDTLLAAGEVETRLLQALSEAGSTRAAGPAGGTAFELYRAKFDALWEMAPFAGQSTDLDLSLDSKGPRTTRARNIFKQLYAEDAAFKTAYDANTARLKQQVDTYLGPAGLNLLLSPRLQRLRAAFLASPGTVATAAQWATLRGAVVAAAAPLDGLERQTVANSNEWQRLINQQVPNSARQHDLAAIIATAPAAPPPPPAPPAPPPPPPAPQPGAKVTPQQFVDGVTLDGPAAAIVGDHRSEPAILRPVSPVANPGVAVDTRITLTPAKGVDGPAVSPTSPWPASAVAGAEFPARIRAEAAAVDATLDLLHGPVARATPPAKRRITITDHRQANLIANWKPQITFDDGGNPRVFTGAEAVQYRNGIHNFQLAVVLPAPLTNPGLPVSIMMRVKRGAAPVFTAPAAEPLPADQNHTAKVAAVLNEPAGLAPPGDPLKFEFQLLDATSAVLSTQTVPITVRPSVAYTKAMAEAAAVADHDWLNDAGGFLTVLTAAGGLAARLADSIKAGTIILQPLTIRHDSAAFVAATHSGTPHPEETAYFAGATYAASPNTGTFIAVTGAGAISRLGGVLATATPHLVAVNRTKDVAAGAKRGAAELVPLAVHEATHALDLQAAPETDVEFEYKTEFRAYWNDGRFKAKATKFDPNLPAPGPRSERARAIFGLMYGNTTYKDIKRAYDTNPAFRRMVDDLLFPDGINLVLSPQLDALQALIGAGVAPNFVAFRNKVRAFVGQGPNPVPAVGVLNPSDQLAVRSSRAWRDLVESKVPVQAQAATIKSDLGIP